MDMRIEQSTKKEDVGVKHGSKEVLCSKKG